MGIFRSTVTPGEAVDRVAASMPTPAARVTAATVTDPSSLPIASPWSSSDLQRIVFDDIFGGDLPPNTRSGAMRIPAIARARNLLVSTICRFPLVTLGRGQTLPPIEDVAAWTSLWEDSPAWLTAAGNTPAQQRIAWTVDDLVFYGWSLWWRENDPSSGFPVAAGRVNQESWQINDDNQVEIDGRPVRDQDVILIPGLHEGILSFGADAIRDTRSLYRNVRARLDSPVPPIDLHQTGGRELTATERSELIALWSAARRGESGAVGYTSKDIEARELGSGGEQLMIEERNAAAVEMARLVGVHAGLIDATTPKSSLNYETATGRNQEFVDFDLALYMTPITARLSMDDITPPGTRTAFDLGDFTGPGLSPTGPRLGD